MINNVVINNFVNVVYPESMIGTTSGCPPPKSTNNQGFNFVSGRSWNFSFENIKRNVFLTWVGCNYEFWKNWVSCSNSNKQP